MKLFLTLIKPLNTEFHIHNMYIQIKFVPNREHITSGLQRPSQLRLFGETVEVYCKNHTEHTNTVRTSKETPYVSATELNRLTLFG
jgi:hypothetical protein